MKIGIDIDNVIANTFHELSDRFNDFMGRQMEPLEVIETMRNNKLKMWAYWFTAWKEGMLSSVSAIDGSADTIREWYPYHEIKLVTSRMPIFRNQTIHWLKKHSIPYHELHHAKEKTKHTKAQDLELFIEDNFEESEILADYCDRVFLFDHPWNRRPSSKKNIIRVKNWEEIKSFL